MLQRLGPLARGDAASSLLLDLHWALESLEGDGALRINCGAPNDRVGPGGKKWSRDRCFDGGARSSLNAPPIPGAEDPWIFAYFRWSVYEQHSRPGYSIPAPDGLYELTLHFAYTSPTPTPRVFDVLIEDDLAIQGMNHEAAGWCVPVAERRAVTVRDGSLDIVFRTDTGFCISAIEVERVDGPAPDGRGRPSNERPPRPQETLQE